MAESNLHQDQFNLEQDGFLNDLLRKFPKQNLVLVGILIFGVLLMVIGGGLYLFKGSGSGDDIKIIEGSTSASSSSELVVHIDGAVAKPGVYHLPSTSRVNDAVAAAGGLTSNADSAKINLAAKLADGQKLHIASLSDTVSSRTPLRQGSEGQASSAGSEISGLISINSASQSELESLPAIGPVTAGKIIAARPYSSLEELVSKKAVGKSTFEKIKDLITY